MYAFLSVYLIVQLFYRPAHQAILRRLSCRGVATDGANEDVHQPLGLHGLQGLLKKVGMDFLHFIGKDKGALCFFIAFCLCRGEVAGAAKGQMMDGIGDSDDRLHTSQANL